MKMYIERTNEKSWSIKLEVDNKGNIFLSAVDTDTGLFICPIIEFSTSGNVILRDTLEKCLKEGGYNPYEHNNKFENGALFII